MDIPEIHYTRSGDVAIAYQVVGEGTFDLVFVPTFANLVFPWLNRDWKAFYDRLASFTRLIMFDKRGTGLSDRPRDLGSLEARMDDIRAVLDAIGAGRAVLVGAGGGGQPCAMFAATYPERTRALVLVNTPARAVKTEDYPYGLEPDAWHEMLDVARRVLNARSVALPADTLIETFGDIARETRAFVEGAQPDRIPDSVLATVLFTDLVGSTQRVAALGDRAWRDLLTRHHEDVRRDLARFRGQEVDSAGDGFFCRFDGPARAMACARAIVSRAKELDLGVRAGIHTGECEVVGEKLAGISVVTGARVAALADPSEVLVSQTVKDLVAGSGFGFVDRGEHELKGVPGTWRVYAVAEG